MRSKLNKFLRKEEGFTLVELLAVIVILGIIVAIAIPAVGSVINRAESDADDSQVALVEDAARLYVTTEQQSFTNEWSDGTTLRIPISDGDIAAGGVPSLYAKGFLEDRAGEEPIKGIVTVTRELIEGETTTYTYEYAVNITP